MLSAVSDAPRQLSLPERRRPAWIQQAWLVFRKDLRIEANSGEVTTTSAFFSLLVLALSSMSFYGGPTTGRAVMAGVV